MQERVLVERLRRLAARTGRPELVLGIGDDCAIYRPGPREDLVFTTDLFIEDVHFRRATHPPEAVGHKILTRGLSDIAAMGASPRFCLLSMALPSWADDTWIDRMLRGLLRLARRTGTALAGGDLSSSERFTADIVVCGAVKRGAAIRRDGAQPGDQIVVSGRLGGSALGLATGEGNAWKRHLWPQARLALGAELRSTLKATAAMDLSDGISIDLARLCQISGVAAQLDRLPLYPGATDEQALHGGEDYELLITVPHSLQIPRRVAGTAVASVGRIVKGKPGSVTWRNQLLVPAGWEYFQ